MGKKSRRKITNKKTTKSSSHVTSSAQSVEELLDMADSFGAHGDPLQQISVLTKAIQQLKCSCMANEFRIASVIGKCAECKASIGDAEGARVMFEEGIRRVFDLDLGYDEQQQQQLHENINTGMFNSIGINESMLVSGFYFYLGQLHEEQEALQYYMDGIALLEANIATYMNNNDIHSKNEEKNNNGTVDDESACSGSNIKNESLRQLCSAYCSVADLYLTDLCFEENAESQCETMLNKAAELDTKFSIKLPDPWQGLANLRLSQRNHNDNSISIKVEEAFTFISRAFTTMEEGCNELARLVGVGVDKKHLEQESNELTNVDEATNLPGYEFREQTVKILLECASLFETDKMRQNQCCEASIQVLGSLLAEDDEVVEVWYLMGCAFLTQASCDNETETSHKEHAKYYLKHALHMLKKSKKVADDAEEKIEINQHINEVQMKLNLCDEESNCTAMMED